MPSLTDVRQAVIAQIQTKLPQIKVEPFLADLSVDSLSRQSFNTMTILVAVLEAKNIAEYSLDFNMLGSFAVFCLVRQKNSAKAREEEALRLAQEVSLLLHGQTFQLNGTGPAKIIHLAPLGESQLEAKGINIWSVIWQQALVFDA